MKKQASTGNKRPASSKSKRRRRQNETPSAKYQGAAAASLLTYPNHTGKQTKTRHAAPDHACSRDPSDRGKAAKPF